MPSLGAFDLIVVGGGVNGAGIARDAAGRGLSVLLVEKDDLAQGTSSRSSKLVHGGLRYLEYHEFRLVREALIEREVLLAAAPHIVWPMRFVLPHSPEQRPAWLVRLGLFLYDHLGGRKRLPGARSLNLARAPEGAPIKEAFGGAFEYSDCWVDDARLVVLNAIDARRRGATIRPRVALTSARRDPEGWSVALTEAATGAALSARGRVLINAAGPWVEEVLRGAGSNADARARLVKGSHIVTRKFWKGDHAYILQNADQRVVFVIPYQTEFCLIGTTDISFEGDPDDVEISGEEIDYLLDAVNRYFVKPSRRDDVVACFSGLRPLYDDKAANPSAVTRDYVFDVDAPAGLAPMLTIFGGKITTYRKLAGHALDKLKRFLPAMGGPWTDKAPLPGGDMPDADFGRWFQAFTERHPWLPERVARDYGRRYGTRAEDLLRGADSLAGLGRAFGPELYEREARFLMAEEWAATAEDILARRTKHALRMSAAERDAFAKWIADGAP
jgi:glycerol-3-phosphate dehydrogenase